MYEWCTCTPSHKRMCIVEHDADVKRIRTRAMPVGGFTRVYSNRGGGLRHGPAQAQGVSTRAGPGPRYLDPGRGPNHIPWAEPPTHYQIEYCSKHGPNEGTQGNTDHVNHCTCILTHTHICVIEYYCDVMRFGHGPRQ